MCAKPNDYGEKTAKAVAVYCWSRTQPGTERWEEAEKMGRLLATNGFSVITGGYCGSMEAVSKGAREAIPDAKRQAESPQVVGITVSGIFPDRELKGNAFLTEDRDSTSMMNRIDQLTNMSRYFVILPGTLGTLQELTCIWCLSAIQPKGIMKPVIIAFRNPWEKICRVSAEEMEAPEQLNLIQFVDSVEEAMAVIREDYERNFGTIKVTP